MFANRHTETKTHRQIGRPKTKCPQSFDFGGRGMGAK